VNLGHVVILAGGLSAERDVSIRSGRRVADALRRRDFDVEVLDIDDSLAERLASAQPACVIPLVHGAVGEDGTLHELLSGTGFPYVGSEPAACRHSFDKPTANAIVSDAGFYVPQFMELEKARLRESGTQEVLQSIVETIGLPLVVKPSQGGSSLGVSVVRAESALPAAMVSAFAYGPTVLVQACVEGTEVAVPVIDTGSGPHALPVVEIRADGGVYDYHARYTAGSTEFITPARLAPELLAACADAAVGIHRALGLRDWSRSDLIVDAEGQVWFLEANVSPGMTETSTYPQAVHVAGLSMGQIVEDLIDVAISRG